MQGVADARRDRGPGWERLARARAGNALGAHEHGDRAADADGEGPVAHGAEQRADGAAVGGHADVLASPAVAAQDVVEEEP